MTASGSSASNPTPRPGTPADTQAPTTDLTKADAGRGRHAAEPSLGQLVSEASEAMSTLVRSEIELAKIEVKASVKNLGVGAGGFIAAAVLLLFSLVYFFQAIAETFARYLVPRFVAFFITFGILVLGAGLLAFIGFRKVKRVRAPEKTIKTTKETVDYLKKSRGT
jgi:Putative Actinobacterial Holin-X, holin superfamily III